MSINASHKNITITLNATDVRCITKLNLKNRKKNHPICIKQM